MKKIELQFVGGVVQVYDLNNYATLEDALMAFKEGRIYAINDLNDNIHYVKMGMVVSFVVLK